MLTLVIKKTVCAVLTAAVIIAAVPSENLKANNLYPLKYEFEEGVSDGAKFFDSGWNDASASGDEFDVNGFSGGGFAYIEQKGTSVSINAEIKETGLYELRIRYCEPFDASKKVQYLNVNGVNQGEISFVYNLGWEEISAGIVLLNEGTNNIEIEGYWGYTFLDYVTIEPADESITNLSPDRHLSNPNATDTSKRLYNYLCDVYGKNILSGQQEYCGSHNYSYNPDSELVDNEAEFEYLLEKTGKEPAVRGIDFLNYNSTTMWDDKAAERCIEWTNRKGGIVTLCWHWGVPNSEGAAKFYYKSDAYPDGTEFSITKALQEGTAENKIILKDIDIIAGKLKMLQDADVSVIWRPLHEAEGGWFWWGAEGPESCKQLYRLLYDKLTNEYGLNNLIWLWTSYDYPTSPQWYPGNDVVDLVGYDKYNAKDGKPNLSAISSTFYNLVKSTDGQKIVAMSENDSIPSLENIKNERASWLYFCPWYNWYLMGEQNNPIDNLKEMYNSEYCITLDELPDLKSYPLYDNESIDGDVNADGVVDISDLVLLNKYIVKKADIKDLNGSKPWDVNKDNNLNVFDSMLLKRKLMN